jgi:ABC-type sulfate transport system permease component
MKRAIVGGFLALSGTILELAVLYFVGNNLVGGWSTPPGRFITTVSETGMTAPFVLATILLGLGILILVVEYFRKD